MNSEIIRAAEIADRLECSQAYAYKIIRTLNEELKHKGVLTIKGHIPRAYFEERYGLTKFVK